MKLNIDWSEVPAKYKYAAMDSSGGVFLYEELPYPQRTIWDSCGERKPVEYPVENHSASGGALDWKYTLTERPQKETDQEILKLALEELIFELADYVDPPPDKECSCHISPPCNDCVDYSHLRELLQQVNELRQERKK